MISSNPARMRVLTLNMNPLRGIILWSFAILCFSCSTTRQIEKKQNKKLYHNLELNKDRNDNAALYKEAASWLNVPHVDGGSSRRGTDCSYLVHHIYKTIYNKTIERSSSAMLKKNCKRISRNKLKEGNLVFFNTGGRSKSHVSHVGIYLKDNKFLHTSTSKK